MTQPAAWRSPVTGRMLYPDTPHSLADDTGERWPVIDDIAYLRAGSRPLASAALALLDDGALAEATALLLAENDAWWDEPAPPHDTLLDVVRNIPALSLREAMARLGWGRVADYFAHRWSDPTFVAALALTDAHWNAPESGFELACGIGHHLRAWASAGTQVTGGDVVFGKLWIARHFIVPQSARLICFDAEAPWPVTGSFDLVACNDAFYFFRDKAAIAASLRDRLASDGLLVVAHIHNSFAQNHSGGLAVAPAELEEMFPGCVLYDDAAWTRAGADLTPASPGTGPELDRAEAVSLVLGSVTGNNRTGGHGPLLLPAPGARLVRNPLLTPGGIAWPSPRYEQEYGPLASYGRALRDLPETAVMNAETIHHAARRDLLSLPERW